jgi:hypothetical protein
VRDKEIASVWYPSPPVSILEIGNNITARVLDGEPAYQLSSGEVVKLCGNRATQSS